MPRQANIVSFDAARRAATGTRVSRASGGASSRAGRVLVGGDQSAVVREGRTGTSRSEGLRPTPSWYSSAATASSRRAESPFAAERPLRATRFADDEGADDNDERLEAALAERNRGPFGRLRSCSADRRRERTKERADRAYFRQYEAGKAADGAAGGPRAAVYKGEMGATHKRSSRMQQTAAASPSRHRGASPAADKGSFFTRPWFMGLAATALTVAFGVVVLYGPAQQLYLDIREKDRLGAEYAAVVDRNEAIDAQVRSLQTDEGVEDMARTQLGWVREGEHAVSVSGLKPKDVTEFRGNIVSEDIPLPDTWYSGLLDPFFGVE